MIIFTSFSRIIEQNLKLKSAMKKDIHPDYNVATVSCACGNTFQTRSTVGDLKVEICYNCHPFYTGKQKLIDTAGRVDKYNKRYRQEKSSPVSDQ